MVRHVEGAMVGGLCEHSGWDWIVYIVSRPLCPSHAYHAGHKKEIAKIHG